ncbi:hypothetical protein [Paraburkholderia caledonica]|uniref:hypothetical protein n=1 Tax=Paraburkholderia caledonica TaxID=134536 RepID=UPI00277D1045|nr:hypothetical protein [Paraburkholderia caledonica]
MLTGDKVPAVAGNRLLFRDGILVATLVAGKFDFCLRSVLTPIQAQRQRHRPECDSRGAIDEACADLSRRSTHIKDAK